MAEAFTTASSTRCEPSLLGHLLPAKIPSDRILGLTGTCWSITRNKPRPRRIESWPGRPRGSDPLGWVGSSHFFFEFLVFPKRSHSWVKMGFFKKSFLGNFCCRFCEATLGLPFHRSPTLLGANLEVFAMLGLVLWEVRWNLRKADNFSLDEVTWSYDMVWLSRILSADVWMPRWNSWTRMPTFSSLLAQVHWDIRCWALLSREVCRLRNRGLHCTEHHSAPQPRRLSSWSWGITREGLSLLLSSFTTCVPDFS